MTPRPLMFSAPRRALWLLALAVCLGPLTARAQQLTVQSKIIQPPEMGPLTILEVRHGGETFSLVPPRDWLLKTDGTEATLQFSSRTGTLSIRLQFTTNDLAQVAASTDSLRQYVVPNLSDTKLLEEFPAYSGDGAGKGIVLSHAFYSRALRSQVVAVALPRGTLQAVLTCGADEFKAGQQTFGAVLTSFQRLSAPATARR